MGFKIKTVQIDNGREFTNSMEEKLTAFELKLITYVKLLCYNKYRIC